MPPAKHQHRSARAFLDRSLIATPIIMNSDPHPDVQPAKAGSEKPHPPKTPARPAMPSGTVRARRVYPRHRKGKLRTESPLEPAAPNPSVLKQPQVTSTNLRSVDSKKPTNVTTTNANITTPVSPVSIPPTTDKTDSPAQPAAESVTSTPSHDSRVPQTSNIQPRTSSSQNNLQCDAPAVGNHQKLQVEYPHPHQVHPPHQHINHQESALKYHHMVPQHLITMHPHARPHFNPQLMHIPSSLQLTHVVPTQTSLCMPHQQHDMSYTHHQPLPIQPAQPPVASPRPVQPTASKPILPPDLVKVSPTGSAGKPQVNSTAATVNKSSVRQVSTSEHKGHGAAAAIPIESPSLPHPTAAAAEQQTENDILEEDKISQLVSRIKASVDGPRARPLICQDITNSNADTLRISRLPRGMTYDRLLSMVEPFGEVEDLAWTASDPYVCDVTYRDASAAHEAKHFLGDALVGSDSEPPLKAELRSRDPGAQLFVGDLTPEVTEEMLEAAFSELVGEPVTALLKRDPDSYSPIGYGFLSFKNESSANFALVAGHRMKVGNASVRVGRAERNTYLYVSDLSPNVNMDELKGLFGKFGALVDEDTVIVRRSYAFIRYKNRGAAEKAKRTLDKTDLKGRLSVRYAEAEPVKACVAVQFHSSVPRPPNSLRDLLTATFSKHGNCSVEIPRLSNGLWRKVAFVTFHGDPIAANMAALEAVQSIRFVSSLPVCCQFARELIPRFPSRGLSFDKESGHMTQKENRAQMSDRFAARNFLARKNSSRKNADIAVCDPKENRGVPHINEQPAGQHMKKGLQQNGHDFVPVYIPLSALHAPNQQLHQNGVPSADCDFSSYQWQNRMLVPSNNTSAQNLSDSTHNRYR